MSESLTLTEDAAPGTVARLRVAGTVDLGTADQLARALAALAERDVAEVLVDLADVGFLDSTGLGALVTSHRALAARDARLVLVRPPDAVVELLRITGLDQVIAVGEAGPAG